MSKNSTYIEKIPIFRILGHIPDVISQRQESFHNHKHKHNHKQ